VCATEVNGHFCEKILLFVSDFGGTIMTQRRGEILGEERSRKHCDNGYVVLR